MPESVIKQAVVLMNLGSPDSMKVKDVRRYLNKFLMDARVIDNPYLLRLLLVRGIIVPFRAAKSAKAYQSVWTDEGSPLIVLTRQLQQAVQKKISQPVVIAMRYGNPAPMDVFKHLQARYPGLEEILLLPLYPHYAMSSYGTAVAYAREALERGGFPFKLKVIPPYYNEANYIHSLSESIRPYLERDYDHILFSYHGVPQRHIRKDDITGNHCLKSPDCCETDSPAHLHCYRHQCRVTTQLVAARLRLPAGKYSMSFQSRLGKEWLEPFTDIRLAEMPAAGIKRLLVVCPSFVSDCLETLQEIAMEGKDIFMSAGGVSFTLIPCLNVHPLWVDTIASWIRQRAPEASGWVKA